MDDSNDVIFVENCDTGVSDPSDPSDSLLCDSETEADDCDFDECKCDKGCTNPHRSHIRNIDQMEVREIIDLDTPKKVNMSYLETESISNISKVSPTIKTEIETIANHRKVLKRKPVENVSSSPRKTRGRKAKNQKIEPASSTSSSQQEQELGDFLEKNVICAYSRGDIVWAKINGYSFWPAMIDDDPDIKMSFWSDDFSTTPTHYHVVFFDAKNRLSRSWCKPNQIKAYGLDKVNISEKHYNTYKARFRESVRQADEAMSLSVENRIKRFSFLSRKKNPGTQLCQD